MTPNAFRKLALSLPDAVEGSHLRHADFRIGGKIFATLGYPSTAHGCIMLGPDEQELFIEQDPIVFAPAAGAWGRQGSTNVVLKSAKLSLVKSALLAAWRRKAPKGVAAAVTAKKPKR